MKRFLEMFEEPAGGISSTRVVLVLWFLMLTACYGVLAIRTGTLPQIPSETVALSAALLGGKWAQRHTEAKEAVESQKEAASS